MQTDHSILNVSQGVGSNSHILLAIPFIVVLVLYLLAVAVSNRKHKKWPISRTILWGIGVGCALVAVSGPVAQRAHMEFSFHMLGHLLLGMLAPLLLVLAAPRLDMLWVWLENTSYHSPSSSSDSPRSSDGICTERNASSI